MPQRESRVKRRAILWMVVFLSAVSTEAASQQCFDEAPSVLNGADPFEFITPTRLTSNDRKAVEQLFARLQGRWSGSSKGYFCRGTKGAARREADDYRIEMNATRDNPNEILLTSQLTSIDNTTTKTEKLRLFLSENTLRVDVDDPGGEVGILQMPRGSSPIEFLHKVITRNGSTGNVMVTEILYRIQVSASSLAIKFDVYFIGGLASGSTWTLTRR